jgi:hypothetical protein
MITWVHPLIYIWFKCVAWAAYLAVQLAIRILRYAEAFRRVVAAA